MGTRAESLETGGGLRAGAAVRELPVAVGTPLMGYGAREGQATGVHDPLHARALHVASGEAGLLLVEAELCLLGARQADAVRDRIGERTGLAREQIAVACAHTHAGPDTGLAQLLAGAEPPAHLPPLLDALVEAGVAAYAGAEPARIGVGRACAAIGRNRRSEGGAYDEEVLIVRLDRTDGTPLACLFVHGCHPTALGHENLEVSADWPAAAQAEVGAALPGAVPIFALGAHADVDPRTRGLLDLAVPDQSRGVSFEACQALGRELGRAVAEAALAIETSADAAVGAAATRLRIPCHPGEPDEAADARHFEALRRDALAALELPPDAPLRTAEFYGLEHERTRELPLAERRARIARVRRYLRDRNAPRYVGSRTPEVEVQVLRLGPAWLLALPLEAVAEVGLEWKRRMGGAPAALLSIANGWLRYLPHPSHFDAPGAEEKYEVLQSSLVPDAALRLLDAGERLARRLGHAGGEGGHAAPASARRAVPAR